MNSCASSRTVINAGSFVRQREKRIYILISMGIPFSVSRSVPQQKQISPGETKQRLKSSRTSNESMSEYLIYSSQEEEASLSKRECP